MSQQDNKEMAKYLYKSSAMDFKKIPSSPIAYWATEKMRQCFVGFPLLSDVGKATLGMNSTNNLLFVRAWFETSFDKIDFSVKCERTSAFNAKKWFPYNKGGDFRKWYGNRDYTINWEANGISIHEYNNIPLSHRGAPVRSKQYQFRESVTWSFVSSSKFGVRYSPTGSMFDVGGSSYFPDKVPVEIVVGFLCSCVAFKFLDAINPTLNFQVGNIASLPITNESKSFPTTCIIELIRLAKLDWDFYESSWDFTSFPLLHPDHNRSTLSASYRKLQAQWHKMALEMQRLEEENNRIFIDAYGLQDELTPEVPLSEITLTCNPHYRYGSNLSDEEREARLQSDTLAELISYAIGCMMGRYSLDREGLVYAHAGNEGFKALVEEGAYSTFAADEDGILPLTSDNWFPDDVAARFEAFIRTVWGAETLEENLQFIADSLCLSAIKPVKKGGETARETIRRYLSTQFFKDHMKTYKKRPIYWLFSSGKEKAFECLVYLHRYNEATLPRMRTEYVTPLLGQMAGRIERLRLQQAEAGTAEAKRIGKEIDTLSKQLTELRAFDDELKHHADMRITLDLDDGVKVNYGKFGNLLSEVKAITGDKGE